MVSKVKKELNTLQIIGIVFGSIILIGIIWTIASNLSNHNSNDVPETGNIVNSQTCNPKWECSSWTECSKTETQTRTCVDSNNCGTNSGKPKTSQSCNYEFGIGDTIVVDDVAYTLNSKTESKQVGEYYEYLGFMGEEADGIFYIFDFTIENVGDESQTFWGTNIKIYDNQGRTFDHDSMAEIYLDDSFSYDQLQPGLPKRGKIIFDVPENLEGKIEISSTDWLSDEVEYISWQ